LSTLWLRDACPCPQCVDPDSGQKNFSTTDLPDNPKIKYAQLNADGSLTLEWPNDKLSGGKNHISTFPADEVQSWAVHEQARGSVVPNEPGCRLLWDRTTYESLLNDGRCSLSYDFWMNSDEAFWRVFSDLVETGLIFIYDVPDREQEVERIARRIGILMHTFYGHTWDVKSKPKAENVAYTSAFLGLHQDLLYYDPVPKLQLLHCLANSCEGGESLFSNGIRAAYEVKLTNSLHYDVLTRHQNPFYYQKGEHHYFHRHPTIGGAAKDMYPRSVYWAPPFQTTFGRFDPQLGRWKAAATRFQQIVESPRNMVEMKLKPGVCVIFDNRRILHGRRQFAADTGSRWLQGCYISPQVYLAKVTEMLAREGRL
ncbi:Clavaminate synthase-like protein, partial [Canariomyces notabilis]